MSMGDVGNYRIGDLLIRIDPTKVCDWVVATHT